MRHSVVFSLEPLKSAGLPFSVVVLETREVLAAFKEEGPAIQFASHLDGRNPNTASQKVSLSQKIAQAQTAK
jgi:hypothetical protein